ncbi:NUDIX hydrolase [Streptococcus thoraltensis]|uniref:NUDIX hydrolase n=1 Tax=Streptococcus thoraltensis TaxID=55085 RepID=UPI001F585BFF|nr:NUDIX hydrolase [Streptococcus thoraltensis]
MQEEAWLEWAVRLQALAQNGLAYNPQVFDRERYEEIRDIASQMLSAASGIPHLKVTELFASEDGYQTPKIDTRAAIFEEDKILLVQEANGLWALPGGWCDVQESILSNTIKEVEEETGFEVAAKRLVAVLDKRKNNQANTAVRVIKHFVLCHYISGAFQANSETLDAKYFDLDQLPELSQNKTTAKQIRLCYEAYRAEHWETVFD